MGLYPLLTDNTCYLLAADFDKGNWQEEVKAMSRACTEYGIPQAIEISRSGNGAHLWIFFDKKVPANEARLLGFGLLDKAMEIHPILSFDSYDRLFPNQDILSEGGFGNLIALPLQREARQAGNSSFVDMELNAIEDQWQHLAEIKRLSRSELNKLLSQISPNGNLISEQDAPALRYPAAASCSIRGTAKNYRCLPMDRHPIVLTERREHAEMINNLLKASGIDPVILKGAMKAAERKHVDEHLHSAQVIVATGKYVGEGFDLPRLDTLFLAMPIAWKGSLAQYAGRIHRESAGKVRVTIHDYVDCGLPMLQRMFNKREKSYKTMGYTVHFAGESTRFHVAKQIEAVLV